MTPPKKQVVHGRAITSANQVTELAEALKKMNVPPSAEVMIRMGLMRTLTANVRVEDRLVAIITVQPAGVFDIDPQPATA